MSEQKISYEEKIVGSWDEAKDRVKAWQAQGLKVGFTNGTFDIVHAGHVGYLDLAKQKCDKLVMGLNTDVSVKLYKGPDRPVNDEPARAAVIAALESIDLVVFFGGEKEGDDNSPSAILDYIRPDVIFKGGDYTVDQMPEAQVVLAYGGDVEIMSLFEGFSTTNIIKKINQK